MVARANVVRLIADLPADRTGDRERATPEQVTDVLRDAVLTVEAEEDYELGAKASVYAWLGSFLIRRAMAESGAHVKELYEEGEENLDRCREIYEEIGGSETLHYADAVQAHALALKRLGFGERAYEEYREALRLYDRITRTDDSRAAYVSSNLATLLRDSGRVEESLPLYERSIVDFERLDDRYVPELTQTRANMLEALWMLERFDGLVEQYDLVIPELIAIFNGRHTSIAKCYMYRADALWSAGQTGEARADLERGLELMKSIGLEEDQLSTDIRERLGRP